MLQAAVCASNSALLQLFLIYAVTHMASSQVTFAAPGQAFKRSSASSQPPAYPVESKAKRITRIMLVVNKDFDQIQKKAPDVGFVFFLGLGIRNLFGVVCSQEGSAQLSQQTFPKTKEPLGLECALECALEPSPPL